MKKLTILLFMFFLLASGCSPDENRAKELRKEVRELQTLYSTLSTQKRSLESDIAELQSELQSDNPKYIVTIRIKQLTYTLSIGEHIKNQINSIEMDIPTDRDFYHSVKEGQKLSSNFKVGSFFMDGDLSDLQITIIKKKIL